MLLHSITCKSNNVHNIMSVPMIKVIALFSLLLGIFVLAVSIWTFGSLVYRRHYCNPQNISAGQTTNNESTLDSIWGEFDEMTGFFEGMIFGCEWVAVTGAILQILIALVVLFSPSLRVKRRLKYFIGIHFLSFLILSLTLVLPLAYDRDRDRFHTMTSFNNVVKMQFRRLRNVEFKKFILMDLYLFYFSLIVDSIGLFIAVVISSCLLRHYTVKEHEVELFYDRYR